MGRPFARQPREEALDGKGLSVVRPIMFLVTSFRLLMLHWHVHAFVRYGVPFIVPRRTMVRASVVATLVGAMAGAALAVG